MSVHCYRWPCPYMARQQHNYSRNHVHQIIQLLVLFSSLVSVEIYPSAVPVTDLMPSERNRADAARHQFSPASWVLQVQRSTHITSPIKIVYKIFALEAPVKIIILRTIHNSAIGKIAYAITTYNAEVCPVLCACPAAITKIKKQTLFLPK